MHVGVPKEIKNHEYRVGLTPAACMSSAQGHQVQVQAGAGAAIGLTDAQYGAAGATIAETAAEMFARADMIVKVKEPQPDECAMLRAGQILYTYLHLAPDPEQTKALVAIRRGVHRLRDHHRRRRRLAAARADERSGGAHVDPGRRALPGECEGRPGRAARRRARRGAGPCRRHRRAAWSGPNAVQMAVGHGRARDRAGQERGPRCASSTWCSATASTPCIRTRKRSRRRCSPPTSSSAACWCRVRRRPSSSRAT